MTKRTDDVRFRQLMRMTKRGVLTVERDTVRYERYWRGSCNYVSLMAFIEEDDEMTFEQAFRAAVDDLIRQDAKQEKRIKRGAEVYDEPECEADARYG